MFKLSFNLPWVLFLLLPSHIVAVGYSYTRFEGPVAGPEHKILVPDVFGQGSRIDFVAKPEYNFAYGVEDANTRVLHNHKERRDGDQVKGVYSVVDPDGTLRIVKYTADNVHGFQAKVITNGISTIYGDDYNNDDDDVADIKQQVQYSVSGNSDENNGKTQYQVHEDYDEDDSEETYSSEDGSENEQDTYDESSEEGYEETSNQKGKTDKSNSEYEY